MEIVLISYISMISIQCTQWTTPKKSYPVQELKLSQIDSRSSSQFPSLRIKATLDFIIYVRKILLNKMWPRLILKEYYLLNILADSPGNNNLLWDTVLYPP